MGNLSKFPYFAKNMENLNDTAQQHSHYTMHHKMFPLFPAQVTVNFVYSFFLV